MIIVNRYIGVVDIATIVMNIVARVLSRSSIIVMNIVATIVIITYMYLQIYYYCYNYSTVIIWMLEHHDSVAHGESSPALILN